MFCFKVNREATPIFAVITDHKARTPEVIDRAYVAIGSFQVNFIAELVQLSLIWGGFDSSGIWHTDEKADVAQLSISRKRPEQEELYRKIAYNQKGNFNCCFDEHFFKRVLIEEGLVELVNRTMWAFPEYSIEHNGEEVLRKQPDVPVPGLRQSVAIPLRPAEPGTKGFTPIATKQA